MIHMQCPDAGGAGASAACKDQQNHTNRQRLDLQAAGNAITAALIARADPCDLALVLRHRMTEPARLWLAAGTILALPEQQAEALSNATLNDIERHRLGDIEAERERQLRAWDRHCPAPAPQLRRARQ